MSVVCGWWVLIGRDCICCGAGNEKQNKINQKRNSKVQKDGR